MYLALTIFSVFFVMRKSQGPRKAIITVSSLGILFAGYFTLQELPTLFAEGIGAFALGLPTCAWGLLFYIAIFILTIKTKVGQPLNATTTV
jgi:hypothetical protein